MIHAGRAPWRRGPWTPEEVATALHERRGELRATLQRRGDLPLATLREIEADAMSRVVLNLRRTPICDEEHLRRAFFAAGENAIRQHFEGRQYVRVGRVQRAADFDVATSQVAADEPDPAERAEINDLFARARDWMASLNEFERTVLTKMALEGKGWKALAKDLGCDRRKVEAAQHGIRIKLERVAILAATAGGLCGVRSSAVSAAATGTAGGEQDYAARMHLAVCRDCREEYVRIKRDLSRSDFQRRAAAAFLPLPVLTGSARPGLLERVTAWVIHHPSGGGGGGGNGERIAAALGGGGVAKAAATGTAIILAGGAITDRVVHTLAIHSPAPAHGHARTRAARSPAVVPARAAIPAAATPRARVASVTHTRRTPSQTHSARHYAVAPPAPPSRRDGFLAVGESANTGTTATAHASNQSSQASGQGSSPPTASKSGSGGNYSYLGG